MPSSQIGSLGALNSRELYSKQVNIIACTALEGIGKPEFKTTSGYFGGVRDGQVYIANSPTMRPAPISGPVTLWWETFCGQRTAIPARNVLEVRGADGRRYFLRE